jgi:hypothetical protein
MEAARFSKMMVSYNNTTWCHNPENLDFRVFTIVKTSNAALDFSPYFIPLSFVVFNDVTSQEVRKRSQNFGVGHCMHQQYRSTAMLQISYSCVTT